MVAAKTEDWKMVRLNNEATKIAGRQAAEEINQTLSGSTSTQTARRCSSA